MTRHSWLFPLLIALALPAIAQTTPAPAPKVLETPKDDFVVDKGMVGRVFDVKHRDPADLASALRPLGSGARGAAVQPSREFRTLTVRDFPENIASIEGALKRLDVPEPARSDVELRLWVLVAGNAETGGRLPDDLKDAVAALKSTLTFKSYSLAATFVERVRDGARTIRGEGLTDIGDPEAKSARGMELEYQIASLSIGAASSGAATIRLDSFGLSLSGLGRGRAAVHTDVTLRDGEKVVVGTSTFQDRALVVVVSGKILK